MNLPAGYKIKRIHLHPGNTSKSKRHGHKYVTISTILDECDNVVGKGTARCSRGDAPSRRLGREIADGRAYKQYLTVIKFFS